MYLAWKNRFSKPEKILFPSIFTAVLLVLALIFFVERNWSTEGEEKGGNTKIESFISQKKNLTFYHSYFKQN